MTPIFPSTYDFLNFILQSLLVLVAIAAVWLFYRYVRSFRTQARLTATRQLADAAVEYAEQRDRSGELNMPAGTEKGAFKRQIAAQWLQNEMANEGLKIDGERAEKWVGAAFQKKWGDSQPPVKIKELAGEALDLTQMLHQKHLIEAPSSADRSLYITGFAADLVVAELSTRGLTVSREQALAYVRGAIVERLRIQAGKPSVDDVLHQLAGDAVRFMRDLRANGKIAIRPEDTGERVERDIATAYLVTEVAKQGLDVSTTQIADAISNALGEKSEAPSGLLPSDLGK